jgi:hypothetical protein
MQTKLKAILEQLATLIGPTSNEVTLLKARLSCRNCKNSDCKNNIWVCTLYGEIPKEFISRGCGSWINNITVK